MPIRINPYQPGFYGIEPVVGVFRPTPGRYDLVFDTPSRRSAGTFTFRFWVNDTTPPSARLMTPAVSPGHRLRLLVGDRGSGVDSSSLLAEVDGTSAGSSTRPRAARYRWHSLAWQSGRHRLVFYVADDQETKNTENEHLALPNTRRLVTTFVVR